MTTLPRPLDGLVVIEMATYVAGPSAGMTLAQLGAEVVRIDPVGGAPFTRAREITVTATLPAKGIGPLPLRVEQAGPGHVVIPDAFLTAAGDWDVRITVRVSEFDEFARVLEVSIG